MLCERHRLSMGWQRYSEWTKPHLEIPDRSFTSRVSTLAFRYWWMEWRQYVICLSIALSWTWLTLPDAISFHSFDQAKSIARQFSSAIPSSKFHSRKNILHWLAHYCYTLWPSQSPPSYPRPNIAVGWQGTEVYGKHWRYAAVIHRRRDLIYLQWSCNDICKRWTW